MQILFKTQMLFMALRARQKLWHRIAFSWITIALLFIFVVVLARGVLYMYKKNSQTVVQVTRVQKELQKLEAREASLRKDLEHIKTSQGIEEELRKKFDVARDGEHLLVIFDKEVEPEDAQKATSWTQKIRSFFNW